MKKILLVLSIILVIPLMTVEKINNKNYYLETETNTYTKEEIDNKINELLTKINDNTTKITETKNILTEIKNKLDNYALKTALTKTNENITTLDELVKSNKERLDELENSSVSGKMIKVGTFNPNGATASNVISATYDIKTYSDNYQNLTDDDFMIGFSGTQCSNSTGYYVIEKSYDSTTGILTIKTNLKASGSAGGQWVNSFYPIYYLENITIS